MGICCVECLYWWELVPLLPSNKSSVSSAGSCYGPGEVFIAIWGMPQTQRPQPLSVKNFQTKTFLCRIQGIQAKFLFGVLNSDLSSWPGDISGSWASIQWTPVSKIPSHLGQLCMLPTSSHPLKTGWKWPRHRNVLTSGSFHYPLIVI